MLKKLIYAMFALLAMLQSFAARATGPDFTTLTASVDYTTAIAAILLVMAGIAGVYIVMSGGGLILQKIRGGK